jgi:PAS domain S-box-containing protein
MPSRAAVQLLATQDVLSRITRRAMLAAGIGLILILLVATAVALAWLRADTLARAQGHLANLAVALGEQTRQSVRSVELLTKATVDELQRRNAGTLAVSDQELFGRMRERMKTLAHVRAVAFVDSNGQAVLHTSAFPTPKVDYGDREYFVAHRDRRIDGLHVGEPVFGRLAQEWLNVFSCRVEGGRSEFRGVVVTAVRALYFQGSYASLNLGTGGRVFLFRDDGILLAMHTPVESAVGRSYADDPLFNQGLAASASGVQRRSGIVDSLARVIAFRRVEGYPLIVTVSATEDAVLSAWRRDAWRIGAGAAGAAAFIGIALFFLLRQARLSASLKSELTEAGEKLHRIVDSAMDAMITVDERQNIVMFNIAAEKIFRIPAAEALGQPLDRFIPERFRIAHRRHVWRFGETGETTRIMGQNLTLAGLRADGEEFPIDASISQIDNEGGKLFTVILRDITTRKEAQAALERSYRELRELSAAMNEVREAERTRIARELHDELAQWLTALKMDVAWLSSRLPDEQRQLIDRTERMKGLVDTMVGAVRRIAAALRPAMLDDLGLVAATESLLHDFSQRTGIVVSHEVEG